MNLFYAIGGGMGHLYRTRIFINHFQITELKIITSNPLARNLFAEEQIVFLNPDGYLASWKNFTQTLPTINVTAWYMDTFPTGITGEFTNLVINSPVHYIARRMRWHNYEGFVKNFKHSFAKVYKLESLEPEHEVFIQQHAEAIEHLSLNYPVASPSNIPRDLIPAQQPLWLVVHAFDQTETEQLIQYANEVAAITQQKPYFVVLSDQTVVVPNGIHLTYFPAADWFPLAEKIFVAGGFNTVQQVLPFLDKVMFLPFPRKFDDQAWRVNSVKISL
jgi:hypothetical protein